MGIFILLGFCLWFILMGCSLVVFDSLGIVVKNIGGCFGLTFCKFVLGDALWYLEVFVLGVKVISWEFYFIVVGTLRYKIVLGGSWLFDFKFIFRFVERVVVVLFFVVVILYLEYCF